MDYEKEIERIDRRIAHCDKWIGNCNAYVWSVLLGLGTLAVVGVVAVIVSKAR